MSIVQELELLVWRLGISKEQHHVCDDAKEFLSSVERDELQEAERQLIKKGVPVEKLLQMCQIDFELPEKDEPDGPEICATGSCIIDVLYHEHEVILDLLENLEGIGHAIQSREIDELANRELTRLPMLIDSLMNVESHHRREDQVVFPELVRVKVRCSPSVLAAEHQRFRDELGQLRELVHSPTTDSERFRQKAVSSINGLVPAWWQHIFKENNILFPSFVDYVTDKHRLFEAKELCDKIGYAGFNTSVGVGRRIR